MQAPLIREPFSIGICVRYDDAIYTLAFVRFKKNGDVILSQHIGDYQRLENGTKFDPHVTYHGGGGIHHLASHGRHHLTRVKQPLGSSFSGWENLIVQSFGRDTARSLGHPCKGYDRCVHFDAADIELREEWLQDSQGTIHNQIPTACFQIDLVEPKEADLIKDPTLTVQTIVRQELIKDTFPWCLITIMAQT